MHSDTQTTPARTSRRRHLAPLIAAGAALGILVTTGITLSPTVAAAAASTPGSASIALPMEAPGAATIRSITVDAESALDAARTAIRDARAMTAEVEDSGLDIGVDPAIDTRALRAAADHLEDLDVLPLLLLPEAAMATAEQTERVTDRIADLRERLDAAIQKKAEEEAAAAKAAAEAAAAAEAQRQAEEAARALAAANTPEGAKATAAHMAASQYGWGADQFSCLNSLWEKESNWNYQAYNGSSGATGIPQSLPGDKMASFGADWQTNATTQIAWGLDYISRAYGTPCAAWGHSQATDWY